MYNSYLDFIKNIKKENIQTEGFKSNSNYQSILEHVSKDDGEKYLYLIEKEFDNLNFSNIKEYLNLNDAYGLPILFEYKNKNEEIFHCSSTSLRYTYHALIILQNYKNSKRKTIVEVGCGYGGLFLALWYFSKLLNIEIEHYYFIDLEPVGKLISFYLDLHKTNISIKYSICSAALYGSDIEDTNLFLISNYCFTEIESIHRNNYIKNLIPKCKSGFIIWQTVFGYDISEANSFLNVKSVEEERPQTSSKNTKNYFLHF